MLKEMIADRKTGKLGGETFTLQLKNDGLKMAFNPGYKLPADVKKAADAGDRRHQERHDQGPAVTQ